jgi:hypothetical protein
VTDGPGAARGWGPRIVFPPADSDVVDVDVLGAAGGQIRVRAAVLVAELEAAVAVAVGRVRVRLCGGGFAASAFSVPSQFLSPEEKTGPDGPLILAVSGSSPYAFRERASSAEYFWRTSLLPSMSMPGPWWSAMVRTPCRLGNLSLWAARQCGSLLPRGKG